MFADRDTPDTMQLVCSFLFSFIRDRELTQLALRGISKVNIGSFLRFPVEERFASGIPRFEIFCSHFLDGERLVSYTAHDLMPYMRMAFCELVRIDFHEQYQVGDALDRACCMIFDDLCAPDTSVRILDCRMPPFRADLAARGIVAFKCVKNVSVVLPYNTPHRVAWSLGGEFFDSAVEHGVRYIELKSEDGSDSPVMTACALSFGFAKPTADRSLLGVKCEFAEDFLAQVKQCVVELDETQHVDFHFKLGGVRHIDPTGFEKYQKKDGQTWLINDLENHVIVEVKQTEMLVEIHVFLSV